MRGTSSVSGRGLGARAGTRGVVPTGASAAPGFTVVRVGEAPRRPRIRWWDRYEKAPTSAARAPL